MPAPKPLKRACLALGTVQLGQPYGVANLTGMPSEHEALELIRAAIRADIRILDTARAYGLSEQRIGLALADPGLPALTVVTKLDPLTRVAAEASPQFVTGEAHASLNASRRALRRERLDVVLLHRALHRWSWQGAAWEVLRAERRAGKIARIGISVGSPADADMALNDPEVEFLQLPFNILDRRWEESGIADKLRARSEVTTCVRSVLLQGLLADTPGTRWPRVAGVDPHDVLGRLRRLGHSLGRSDLIDLCIAYVRAHDWIDTMVIGVETAAQLAEIQLRFERPPLDNQARIFVIEELPRYSEEFLTPSRWARGTSEIEG